MADLKEKTVLVTGADSEAGTGIAQGLAEAGATLYLGGSTSCAEAAAAAEALGGRAIPLQADIADDETMLELFRRVESEAGRLDVLVNIAVPPPDPSLAAFWKQPFSIWDDQCGVGLRGCYVASALAARLMVEQGNGLIVSLSGVPVERLRTAHGVFSAGVDQMVVDMARELADSGVTALSLAPGLVRTEPLLAALDSGQLVLDGQKLHSPRFVGRAIAALAMDPDVHEKTGGRFEIEALRAEYRFSEYAADEPADVAGVSS